MSSNGTPDPTGPTLVVVTGAGSGIGRATSLAYAARGAHVIAADVDGDTARYTVELCVGAGGSGVSVQADVSDPAAWEALTKRVGEIGTPDVVVNNAGIGMAGGFLDTTVADWEAILGVNLWGVIHGCRAFAPLMAERHQGHIVNISSAAAFMPSRQLAAYATTKSAVLMLSACMRAELADRGVGVSAVCPGFVNTGIAKATRYVGSTEIDQERLRDRADRAYRRRNLKPEAVAAAVLRAVDHNEAVVPVGTEAKLGELVSRAMPGLARRFASIDIAGSGRKRGKG